MTNKEIKKLERMLENDPFLTPTWKKWIKLKLELEKWKNKNE